MLLSFLMFRSVCLHPLNVEIIYCPYNSVELTNAKYNLGAPRLDPSCLLPASAITDFSPSRLIPIHLFFFLLTFYHSFPRLYISLHRLTFPLIPLFLSLSSLFSSVSHLTTSLLYSHFSAIFISISLSVRGRGGRVSFREDSFGRHTDALARTNTHTRARAHVSSAIHCLPAHLSVCRAAAKLDVIKCNWCSVWGELESREGEEEEGRRRGGGTVDRKGEMRRGRWKQE